MLNRWKTSAWHVQLCRYLSYPVISDKMNSFFILFPRNKTKSFLWKLHPWKTRLFFLSVFISLILILFVYLVVVSSLQKLRTIIWILRSGTVPICCLRNIWLSQDGFFFSSHCCFPLNDYSEKLVLVASENAMTTCSFLALNGTYQIFSFLEEPVIPSTQHIYFYILHNAVIFELEIK